MIVILVAEQLTWVLGIDPEIRSCIKVAWFDVRSQTVEATEGQWEYVIPYFEK